MNQQLEKINKQAKAENLKVKLDLIQDIINCKKQLFGFGVQENIVAIKEPEKLFDALYEMTIEGLELILAQNCAEASMIARKLIGFTGYIIVGFKPKPDCDNYGNSDCD